MGKEEFSNLWNIIKENISEVLQNSGIASDGSGSDDSEGEQQQHSGDNVNIWGKGSNSGWSIKAPKADSDGSNMDVDISDVHWSGKGNSGSFLKTYFGSSSLIVRGHSLTKAVDRTQNALSRLQKPDSIICDFCSGKRFPIIDKKLHSNVRDTTTNGNPVSNN